MQRAMAAHHAFRTCTGESEVHDYNYVVHDTMAHSIRIQCTILKTMTDGCNQYVVSFASHGQLGLDKMMSSFQVNNEELLTWATDSNNMQPFPAEFSTETWMSSLSPTGQIYLSTPSVMRAVIASTYTLVLTILDAIRRFKLYSSPVDKMVVQFLESNNSAIGREDFFLFEEILHQLPSVRTLVLKFIGTARDMSLTGEMCNSCSNSGRQITMHDQSQ